MLLLSVFFDCAIHEMMSIMQCAVLLLLTIYYGLWKKDRFSAYATGIVLLMSFCAFFINYFSPAVAARMHGSIIPITGRIFQALKVAIVFGSITAMKFFTKPIIYALLLFLPALVKTIKPFDDKIAAFMRVKFIVLIVALVAFFNQAIGGFALGIPLVPRAEGLAIWMMTATWVFLWVFCYRNEKLFRKIENLRITHWRNAVLVLCLILSANFIGLLRDIKIAPLYAQEMRERFDNTERQRQQGKKEIFLPSLRHIPKSIFYMDLTLFSENTFNNSDYSKYWGVDATACYPYALGEKSFKSSREVIDTLKTSENSEDPEVLFKLGEVYDTVFPVMGDTLKDNTAAAQYYLRAAQKGYTRAQSRLIRVYATGAGVSQNYFQALYWLLRSWL
ncbi:hypothetical protein AGMMS50276_09140 [Synergistales bacterium]|nr:hypothetical protein AGMMS50276_09140 [Synergistales bacterium]